MTVEIRSPRAGRVQSLPILSSAVNLRPKLTKTADYGPVGRLSYRRVQNPSADMGNSNAAAPDGSYAVHAEIRRAAVGNSRGQCPRGGGSAKGPWSRGLRHPGG